LYFYSENVQFNMYNYMLWRSSAVVEGLCSVYQAFSYDMMVHLMTAGILEVFPRLSYTPVTPSSDLRQPRRLQIADGCSKSQHGCHSVVVLWSHRNTDHNGLQCFCVVLEMQIVRLYKDSTASILQLHSNLKKPTAIAFAVRSLIVAVRSFCGCSTDCIVAVQSQHTCVTTDRV